MKENISFHIIRPADIAILEKWVNKSRVQKWFYNSELWLKKMRETDGEEILIHYSMVLFDGKPIGFAQWYDCFDIKDESNQVPSANKIYNIDYFVGDSDYVSPKYGLAIVSELKDIILKLHPSCKIQVHPEPGNPVPQHIMQPKSYYFDKLTK